MKNVVLAWKHYIEHWKVTGQYLCRLLLNSMKLSGREENTYVL